MITLARTKNLTRCTVKNEALSNGIPCIEVDVWLSKEDDNTLLAGHELKNLRPEKTLSALYLDPIMGLLKEAAQERKAGKDWTGLFPLAPQQELILMIDMVNRSPGLPEST